MDVDFIFKIAAIGIIVTVLNLVLIRSGREIYICTDNDTAGHACRERNSNLNTLIPVKKDWNDDLCEKTKELMKKNDICKYNYFNICNKYHEYVEIGCCNKNCDDYRQV